MQKKQPIKIAYADDHPMFRKGVINLLSENKDFNFIIEANNGKEFLKKIECSPALPDICLLDIRMPEMDGFDTLIAIKKKWPEVKVLILTVFGDDIYFSRMVANGANGYITKDSDPTELVKAIRSIYNSDYHKPEEIVRKLSGPSGKSASHDITETEKILLRLCCSGLTYKEIAEQMKISHKSVEGHRDYLFRKLDVNTRQELVIFAIQHGIFLIDR